MSDPLAPFRRPGAAPAAQPERHGASTAKARYQAFGVAAGATRPTRLEIRPAGQFAVARLYSAIAEIEHDQLNHTRIRLMLSQIRVTLDGINLRPVAAALINGTCEFVAEAAEGEQGDTGAALIRKITTERKGPPVPPKEGG